MVEADGVLDVGVLVDARAPERYRGEVEPIDPVAGRIPGAVNVPTEANLDGAGRFRSPEELRATYAEVGATEDATVAAYCGSGVTAAHDVLAMEIAGIRAALYPGSWSGWIADPSRPVRALTRPKTFGRVSEESGQFRADHQWTPLKIRASMICSDCRVPESLPLAAAESGNTW